jgi:transcriptional regulator of met regulon
MTCANLLDNGQPCGDEEFLALERADELRDEFHQVIREINAWHL